MRTNGPHPPQDESPHPPQIESPRPPKIERPHPAQDESPHPLRSALGLRCALRVVALADDGDLLQRLRDALAEQQKYLAEIDFAAMTYFCSNPLLESIMFASGATPDQVDQFFVDAMSR